MPSPLSLPLGYAAVVPAAAVDCLPRRIQQRCITTCEANFNPVDSRAGQTGSGKTYTITGGVDSYEERGLIPRAISLIFKEFGDRADVTYTTHIRSVARLACLLWPCEPSH